MFRVEFSSNVHLAGKRSRCHCTFGIVFHLKENELKYRDTKELHYSSSAGLLGHFPGIVGWRSRSGLWHSYAERSKRLGVGFPVPREFQTTTPQLLATGLFNSEPINIM
ncbi:hypothetical protein TNCV_4527151 [Trichonephila clavipes]|nr:hypothetical protein TNCV_4527151 [Trichonephila clavipes]